MARSLAFCLFTAALVGCASTTIRPNPTADDKGFRFYRPKPFLYVTPVPPAEPGDPEFVEISLQMLPDFGEQYSVHAKAGVGVNKTKVTIDHGWNVTALQMDVDSKTDANIKAAGSLAKNLAVFAAATGQQDEKKAPSLTSTARYQARNVPLGFYEAVIDRDPCGTKQMYGWRYVGFMPYGSCPVVPSGAQGQDCAASPLYGLVHEGGVMVFKQLDQIAQDPLVLRDKPQANAPKSSAELDIRFRSNTLRATLKTAAEDQLTAENTVKPIEVKITPGNATHVEIVVKLEKAEADFANVQGRVQFRIKETIRQLDGLRDIVVTVRVEQPKDPVKP